VGVPGATAPAANRTDHVRQSSVQALAEDAVRLVPDRLTYELGFAYACELRCSSELIFDLGIQTNAFHAGIVSHVRTICNTLIVGEQVCRFLDR
jgi:hypothetical protein